MTRCHTFWKPESHYLDTPSVSSDWSINMILLKTYLSQAGNVFMKKEKNSHILFRLHSHQWNWPCFSLTITPFCCHRPHGMYIVVISFILCLGTNIWQQPLGLTWLKLTRPTKSLSVCLYIIKAHGSSFGCSIALQREKKRIPLRDLYFLRMSS